LFVRFVAFLRCCVSCLTLAFYFSACIPPFAEVVVLAQFLAAVKAVLHLFHDAPLISPRFALRSALRALSCAICSTYARFSNHASTVALSR
jgi:hypothetical protein